MLMDGKTHLDNIGALYVSLFVITRHGMGLELGCIPIHTENQCLFSL